MSGQGCKEIMWSEVKVKLHFFSAKHLDSRNRADLIESATPCHDVQIGGALEHTPPDCSLSDDCTMAPHTFMQ